MISLRWGSKLCLALAACLLLGLLGFKSVHAAGMAHLANEPSLHNGESAQANRQPSGELSQPHQPGLFTHRAGGLPRAGLLLILVLVVQLMILGFRAAFRRR